MDDKELFPVRVGHGNKVHAGTRHEVKGCRPHRQQYEYDALCGTHASSSRFGYSQSRIRFDPYASLEDVNCKDCLERMNKENGNG